MALILIVAALGAGSQEGHAVCSNLVAVETLAEEVIEATPEPTPVPVPTVEVEPSHEPEPGPADAGPAADQAPAPEPAQPQRAEAGGVAESTEGISVYVTFYSCPPYCNHPAGPLPLAEGQAACDPAYMGRRFLLNGAEYICNDTGSAVWGNHVDIFFWDEADGWAYLARYGTTGILRWLD